MNKKAVFLDIDGTMINFSGVMPESTKVAIERAVKNGHKMIICSGRNYFQIYPELLKMNFSGIVGAAGAFVIANGKWIFNAVMTESQMKRIYDYTKEKNAIFFFQGRDGIVLDPESWKRLQKMYEKRAAEATVKLLTGNPTISKTPWKEAPCEKAIFHECSVSLDQVKADLGKDFEIVGFSFDPTAGSGEIGIGGITKETGIKKYLEYEGISIEDTIAFGDGPNDLEMMDCVNYAVAMGNAIDDVKKRADMVTNDIDQDGIYNAFLKLGLI